MAHPEPHKQILRRTGLFSAASDDVLAQVAEHIETVKVGTGETLFQKGDTGDALYVIFDGHVRIHDGELTLKRLGPGEMFGEIGAFSEDARSASVTADSDTSLLKLRKQSLQNLLTNRPEAATDIISTLCRTIGNRVQEIADDTRQIAALEHELEIGRKIQADFLPDTLPEIAGWSIAAHFQAAREVAGDYYDVFLTPDGRKLALVIGDVCGKGVGAALFMTLFRSLIRATATAENFDNTGRFLSFLTSESNPAQLAECVTFTNSYMSRTHGRSSMFSTLFFALLDPTDGTLHYVNAGHEAPFVLRADGSRDRLETTGPVVGIMPGAVYQCGTTILNPGDMLFGYTDGVSDAVNAAGDLFTEERLQLQLESNTGNVGELVANVRQAVDDYSQDASQFDDITMLAVHRN